MSKLPILVLLALVSCTLAIHKNKMSSSTSRKLPDFDFLNKMSTSQLTNTYNQINHYLTGPTPDFQSWVDSYGNGKHIHSDEFGRFFYDHFEMKYGIYVDIFFQRAVMKYYDQDSDEKLDVTEVEFMWNDFLGKLYAAIAVKLHQ